MSNNISDAQINLAIERVVNEKTKGLRPSDLTYQVISSLITDAKDKNYAELMNKIDAKIKQRVTNLSK